MKQIYRKFKNKTYICIILQLFILMIKFIKLLKKIFILFKATYTNLDRILIKYIELNYMLFINKIRAQEIVETVGIGF